MSRQVKEFRDAAELQRWLDECDSDPANVFDIGEPIAFERRLVVMYNVEPVFTDEDALACNFTCGACGELKKHYCRVCDAGKPVQ